MSRPCKVKYHVLTVLKKMVVTAPTAFAVAGLLVMGGAAPGHADEALPSPGGEGTMKSVTGPPFSFVENRGQWESEVRYVGRTGGMVAALQPDAVILQTPHEAGATQDPAVRLTFEGASESVALKGENRQPGVHNYFLGRDQTRWRTDVPGFASVVYRDLYHGVNVRVRETSGLLEYDLLLAPGADLDQVVVRCDGVNGLAIDSDGSLIMETEHGHLTQSPPMTWYQLESGERRRVDCRFRLIDSHRFGFAVPDRDVNQALVIDPVLEWSTYYGGSGEDSVTDLALDPSGAILVAGFTTSDMPTMEAEEPGGGYDWFVCSLSPDGETLRWCTYLGGSEEDAAYGVTADETGRVMVGGGTTSFDFPTTDNAFDRVFGPPCDGTVVCLDGSTGELLYSTFLGGSDCDWVGEVAVDGSGEAVLFGHTESVDLPTTAGAYDRSYGGAGDVFVSRLDAAGSGLVYSTYIGTEGTECASNLDVYSKDFGIGLAIGPSGEVVLGGFSNGDFPTTDGAYDTTPDGAGDAFMMCLSGDGADLIYSTLIGGDDSDVVTSVWVDELGRVTMTGGTVSTDFPTTPGAYDETHNSPGSGDVFVVRLNPGGDGADDLLYSTLIGGGGWEDGVKVGVVTGSGEIVVAGATSSIDWPTTEDALGRTFGGGPQDAILLFLSPDGAGEDDLRYSTYIGGAGWDGAMAMVLGPHGSAILGGYCGDGFPISPRAYQTTYGGGPGDGFICLFNRDSTVGLEDAPTTGGEPRIQLGAVSPNPTDGAVRFTIDLRKEGSVQAHILDVRGRRVRTLLDRRLELGVHTLSMPLEGGGRPLANGVYYLHLQAGGITKSRTFTVAR